MITIRDFCFIVGANTKITLYIADPNGVCDCIFENLDPRMLRESAYRDSDIDRIESLGKNHIALYV